MWQALKTIGIDYRHKLSVAFIFVALENILFLIYPLFGGFAINAVMQGHVWHALTYAILVLVMWLIGAARRSVDTRTFARIYSEIAVPIIVKQRLQGQNRSAISARVALSREFVDFFEMHLPTAITSLVSIFGACLMLLISEFWIGVATIVILIIFATLLPGFTRISSRLYLALNDRLERDVDMIGQAPENMLRKHYGLMAYLRIKISNREALGYLCIGIAISILFAFSFAWITLYGYGSAGHIDLPSFPRTV